MCFFLLLYFLLPLFCADVLKHKQHASRLCTFARCLVSKTIPVFLNLLWTKPKSIFFFCFPIISTMPVSSCCRGSQWLRTYHDTISVIPVSAQVSCVCVYTSFKVHTHKMQWPVIHQNMLTEPQGKSVFKVDKQEKAFSPLPQLNIRG